MRILRKSLRKPSYVEPQSPFFASKKNNIARDNSIKILDFAGNECWLNEYGELHRIGGPAFILHNKAYKEWYKYGKIHREDGPAIEFKDGAKHWYINGQPHRVDGPAIVWNTGEEYYYIDGVPLTKEEFEEWRTLQCVKMLNSTIQSSDLKNKINI